MIKNYLELNKTERINAYRFVSRDEMYKKTFDEIDMQMKLDLYDYGYGSLFMMNC